METGVLLLWLDMNIGLSAPVLLQGVSGLVPCENRSVHYMVNNTGFFLLLYWVNRMIWTTFPGQTLII